MILHPRTPGADRGIGIAVWGDNRATPDTFLDHYLKNVDVLILPVDSILTTDVSGLESADGWVNDQEKLHHADVRRLDRADLTLNAAELKGAHHRIYYFGKHFEEK